MTDEELLKKIHDAVEAIIVAEKKYIRWFFISGVNNVDLYSGNTCPMCAIEGAIDWAKENNIQHIESGTVQ